LFLASALAGRRSSASRYNQGAKTKAAEELERSRRNAAAAAEMSCRATEPSNELSRAGEGSHKHTRHVGELDELAGLKSLASDDDILASLINQQELVTGLEKLLEISDASVDKVTGLVVKPMGDNAKLHEELDKQKEKAAGWRELYEKSVTSRMTLTAVVHELGDDLKKLHIERELQVEESMAAVNQSHEDVKKELEELLAKRSIEK
jgi:hypothetical protein